MNDTIITSEPPATTTKTKKRKMSAASKKALSDAAKARWAAKKAAIPQPVLAVPAAPVSPLPPSPSVLALQEQVVQRVSQRDEVRQRLTEAHTAYLLAQSRFQAAEAELKGIEQEVQYRIGLIAQLENRPGQINVTQNYSAPPLQFPTPGNLAGISSEPSQAPQHQSQPQGTFAVGSADDLRREVRGMM